MLAAIGATLLAAPAGSRTDVPAIPALQRFLAIEYGVIRQATTTRHLEARNEHFDTDAWMDVRTDADATGFRYTVLAEGGSGLVRSKALRGALEQEKRAWSDGAATKSWFTPDNYQFADGGMDGDGLTRVAVNPRRKDTLLLDGAIFLRPEDGALIRIEGTLARSPSFWTKRIQVVRHYATIAGIQLPVAVESTAQIRIAGSSSFRMRYTYLTVNGTRID
ncbi:MAG: hypothetical protein JSU08_08945 [Acidobacteria bacterium]|nr:hypothetical protein [Acidobacteriota bacterium]